MNIKESRRANGISNHSIIAIFRLNLSIFCQSVLSEFIFFKIFLFELCKVPVMVKKKVPSTKIWYHIYLTKKIEEN